MVSSSTPAARTTLRASATTSGPMPSPPMTAILCTCCSLALSGRVVRTVVVQNEKTAHRGGRSEAHTERGVRYRMMTTAGDGDHCRQVYSERPRSGATRPSGAGADRVQGVCRPAWADR